MTAPSPEKSRTVQAAVVMLMIGITLMMIFIATAPVLSWSETGFYVSFYTAIAGLVVFFWRAAIALVLNK